LLALCGLAALAPRALAGGFEIDLHVGRTMPTFEQTLSYEPSDQIPGSAGVVLRPQGALSLDAKGDLAFSGGLTFFFAGPLGIEGRVDGLTAQLDSSGVRYDVRVLPRPPIPGFDARLDLGAQDLRIERVQPISLNLRVVTPGPVRLSASGGVSRLGTMRLLGTLSGDLSTTLVGIPVGVTAAQVGLKAEAAPEEQDKGQYGVNAGLGIQIGLGANLALSAEARGFLFRERTLRWSSSQAPRNAIEQALQAELLARLEPVRFTPTFFSANVGLALRF
jgi:hypothetical protein